MASFRGFSVQAHLRRVLLAGLASYFVPPIRELLPQVSGWQFAVTMFAIFVLARLALAPYGLHNELAERLVKPEKHPLEVLFDNKLGNKAFAQSSFRKTIKYVDRMAFRNGVQQSRFYFWSTKHGVEHSAKCQRGRACHKCA